MRFLCFNIGSSGSKPKAKNGDDIIRSQHPDFSNHPEEEAATRRRQISGRPSPHVVDYRIVMPAEKRATNASDMPPSYGVSNLAPSAQLILETFRRGRELGGNGTTNAFQNLAHRRYIVWADDNDTLQPVTQRAIELMLHQLALVGKAMKCDMEICFMSRNNIESPNLGKSDCEKAEALRDVWKTRNWEAACDIARTHPALVEMKLDEWVNKLDQLQPEPTQTSSDCNDIDDGRFKGSSRKASNRQPQTQRTSTSGTSGNYISQQTSSDKHIRLLAEVRDRQSPYWAGHELRDFQMEQLSGFYDMAKEASAEQPKNLSNVSFTYKREIEAFKRELERKDHARPTTVILLVGSTITESEREAIIQCQEFNDIGSDMSSKAGKTDLFCVETVAFTGYMEADKVRHFKKIDNKFEGVRDINDMVSVDEDRLAEFGPSEILFKKILNPHLKNIDEMKMSEDDKYGEFPLCTNGESVELPSLEEVRKILRPGANLRINVSGTSQAAVQQQQQQQQVPHTGKA
ncbi:hypothetical protein AYO20_08413 [Fonsecaea nubica]|uniref:Uncharacterized protein n=1 Tax=Fonsecaea nubica TaxID=856822 RepID=A0A178CPL3_9EURO|nr:hypothetical protein AYO20_08413 [Fonsecaea nubica]OAL31082.1 hypothetical protein AYO20_08413 [Fonsecaea nubica]